MNDHSATVTPSPATLRANSCETAFDIIRIQYPMWSVNSDGEVMKAPVDWEASPMWFPSQQKILNQINATVCYIVRDASYQFPLWGVEWRCEHSTSKLHSTDNHVRVPSFILSGAPYLKGYCADQQTLTAESPARVTHNREMIA